MAARTDAVEVVAVRVGAVAVEVGADRPALTAAPVDRALVRQRRKIGLLDGRGRHGRVYHASEPVRARTSSGPARGEAETKPAAVFKKSAPPVFARLVPLRCHYDLKS